MTAKFGLDEVAGTSLVDTVSSVETNGVVLGIFSRGTFEGVDCVC